MESEKSTERYLTKRVTELGGLSYKWVSQNNKGVTDRICIFPGNIIFFVEVKSEGQLPTPLQYHVHKTLRERGCNVFVVDKKSEVNRLISKFEELYNDNT